MYNKKTYLVFTLKKLTFHMLTYTVDSSNTFFLFDKIVNFTAKEYLRNNCSAHWKAYKKKVMVTSETNMYLSNPENERSYLHQYHCCVGILSQSGHFLRTDPVGMLLLHTAQLNPAALVALVSLKNRL